MRQPYKLVTNILNKDWKGSWSGKEIELKDGETKLLPIWLAEKFAEVMAMEVFTNLRQDLVGKEELNTLKQKMLGTEVVEVEFPDKSEGEILMEEIEYANNKYLNK